ncbi:hypothetical protein NW767_012755 [Fusarium falciforme]|nr:hypothetical protein NW767_012755 [Fusarium falciforme]
MPSPIYSEAFSTNLASILSHPFWESQIVRLVLALQYAVICRLDDRRHWQVPGFCDALRALTAAMDESPPELLDSIHEMHVEARSRCVPSRPSSAMPDFLEHLGNTAGKAPYLAMPSIEMECFGMQVYPVTAKDLDVLITALNTYSRQGCPVLCSVSSAYQVYKDASNPLDMPKANQFSGLYERATLSERRVQSSLPQSRTRAPQSTPAEPTEVRIEELRRYVDSQMESLTKLMTENMQKNEDTMKKNEDTLQEVLQHVGRIKRHVSATPSFLNGGSTPAPRSPSPERQPLDEGLDGNDEHMTDFTPAPKDTAHNSRDAPLDSIDLGRPYDGFQDLPTPLSEGCIRRQFDPEDRGVRNPHVLLEKRYRDETSSDKKIVKVY